VLATGKGQVLPVLAMLTAKQRLRMAAHGSGPGAKRRCPCLPLRAVPDRKCRDEGSPDPSTPGLRPESNKGLMGRRLNGFPRNLPSEMDQSQGHPAFGGLAL
jgi:hypothetical protein